MCLQHKSKMIPISVISKMRQKINFLFWFRGLKMIIFISQVAGTTLEFVVQLFQVHKPDARL